MNFLHIFLRILVFSANRIYPPWIVNDSPYLLGHNTMGFEEEMSIYVKKYSSNIENLYPDDQNPDNKHIWTSLFYLRRRIQGLCQGTVCYVQGIIGGTLSKGKGLKLKKPLAWVWLLDFWLNSMMDRLITTLPFQKFSTLKGYNSKHLFSVIVL